MALPISRQAFHFGALDRERSDRALGPADVKLAENVVMVQGERYTKSPGFDRLAPSLLTSSLGAGSWVNAADYLTGVEGGLFARESVDGEEWVYNATANRWTSRGALERPFPSDQVVLPPGNTPGHQRPRVVRGTLYEWWFSAGGSSANFYTFTVLDITTREVVVQPTQVDNGSAVRNLAAVKTSDGTIAVYVVDGTNVIARHRHTEASPFASPVSAVYHTATAGSTLFEVDALGQLTGALTLVAAWGVNNVANTTLIHRSLTTANGSTTSLVVDTAITAPGANAESMHGSLLVSDGASGSVHLAAWEPSGAAATFNLNLRAINLTTLAFTTTLLDTIAYADTVVNPLFAACGYVAANGNRIVHGTFLPTVAFASTAPTSASLAISRATTRRYTFDGAAVSLLTFIEGHWVASKPALVGSDWYILFQFDDGEAFRNQRTYFLCKDSIDSSKVVSQALRGLAPAAGNNITLASSGGVNSNGLTGNNSFANTSIPEMLVVNGALVVPALKATSNGVAQFAVTRLMFSFAEDFGPPVSIGHAVVSPGPIPYLVGPLDLRREVAPLSSPPFLGHPLASEGAGFVVQAYYQYTDSNGDVYRSRPTPEVSLTGVVINLRVPTLRHVLNPGIKAQIVLCISLQNAATPQIRLVSDNDPLSKEILFFPSANPTTADADIYTAGGALGNDPWPPARCIAQHRQRLVLGGLEEEEFLQPTREFEPGCGPAINVISRVPWRRGTGNVLALGRVDGQTLGILKADAIGVIEGNGPNGRGAGNFVVKTISEEDGISRARTFCNGPAGLYFQNRSSKIQILTPAQVVRECSQGIDNLLRLRYVMKAGIHDKTSNQVVFSFTSVGGSDILLASLDYRHPTERHPAGRWTLRRSSTFASALHGAAVLGGEVYWVESGGILRKEGGSSFDSGAAAAQVAILPKLRVSLSQLGEILGGDFDLRMVTFLGEFLGTHSWRITVYKNGGTAVTGFPKNVVSTATATPYSWEVPTGNATYCSDVEVEIEEVSTGGHLTQGFAFDGLVVDVQSRNRTRKLPAGRVVT